ncbi:hypothetical protein P7K49_033670 [Saguinus oedipus]|uniref:Uncharacterized protein n=1 Tax=Saguinus oedipus TaxID=9490 RepID=A0ABQ9TSJ2_SAGOE|nr:hypothetical protein P7K49_033670 [Saguinus oedipus]
MPDMCRAVCEPATPAARPVGALPSGRLLNQAELLAPGIHEGSPLLPKPSQNMSPLGRKTEAFEAWETTPCLTSYTFAVSLAASQSAGGGQALAPPSWPGSEARRALPPGPPSPGSSPCPPQTSPPAGSAPVPEGEPGCQKEFNSKAPVRPPGPTGLSRGGQELALQPVED